MGHIARSESFVLLHSCRFDLCVNSSDSVDVICVARLGGPLPGGVPAKAGRRTVEFTAGLWQELLDHGLAEMGKDDLLFHDGCGGRLPYSTFYDRWMAGVAEAKKRGVLPQWKFPTIHDLSHSHVAALLSDRHSLTYVQRRLGHESITTTSDTYGHLLETAHTAALVTIDRVMGFTPPARAALEENNRGHDGGARCTSPTSVRSGSPSGSRAMPRGQRSAGCASAAARCTSRRRRATGGSAL